MKHVLVIGGGAAGLSAAVELARRGIPTTVVERSPCLGGKAAELACKGAPHCVRCDACYIDRLISETQGSSLITILTGAELLKSRHREDGIEATIRHSGGIEQIATGALIVATGAQPYDPAQDPRFHTADCPDVLSADVAEMKLAATGGLNVPSTGRPPGDLAIVQCVGSRDVTRGAAYCSKACCKYAYRLGQHLRALYPDLRLTFFYMDWRPLEGDKGALERWVDSDDHVQTVRARPSEVVPGTRPALRYASPGEAVVEQEFDLVLLSVGLRPRPLDDGMASLAGLGRDEHGFLVSHAHRILMAGTCGGPKDLRESIEDGVAAAGLAAKRLGADR